MRYQIVCTTRKEDGSIDKLGYIQEGGNKNQARDVVNKEKINELIHNKDTFFFTNENGVAVEVLAVEDKYVRTSPDVTKVNNLLSLRACRMN
jgi:hypothetical protein